jgi:DNA-binding winged helix-turn-helix (wHTH) protein
MAFEAVDIVEAVSSKKTGVSVGLTKIKSCKALLRIMFSPAVFQEMGFVAGDRFIPLLGTGEDFGVLRLQKNKGGAVKAEERSFAHNSRYFAVSLRHRPEFVDRAERAVPCQWEKVDLVTIEIVLPKWSDETNPNRRKAIAAVPQEVRAGLVERQRQEAEQREAEERRERLAQQETAVEMTRLISDALKTDELVFKSSLNLTKNQRALMSALWRQRGKVVSRDSLMTLIYADDPEAPDSDKILDVMVSKIRKRLPPSVALTTVHGSGFRLEATARDLLEEAAA